jgi:hypothetical protein
MKKTRILSNLILFAVIATFSISQLTLSFYTASAVETLPLEPILANSKEVVVEIEYQKIDRVESLEKFFDKYKSPLKEHSNTFVEVADKYQIDYRLLPSISCMESTCGKFLIEGSYNPFGWGIYGDNAIYFENYDEAIQTVGEGLSKNYFSKGRDTVEEIAPIYTPPNHVNWKNGVNFFINKIEENQVQKNMLDNL